MTAASEIPEIQNEPVTAEELAIPEEAKISGCQDEVGAPSCEEEIFSKFPSLKGKSLDELINKERYEELRALGLSSEEAFFATAKNRAASADNRSHLGGSVPKGVHAPSHGMSASELCEARELFRGISDEEIRNLYRRVTK